MENYYHYAERIAYKPLRSMLLNVTDACNLRCKYCFTKPNPSVMSLDVAKRAVDWLIEENKRRDLPEKSKIVISFFGGEPTLRWNELIVPLIYHVEDNILPLVENEFDIHFGMTTNGQLLTEDKMKWFKDHNGGILLSIDGDSETQNANRPRRDGKDSFQHLNEIIPSLLYYFPSVTFRSTITPAMVHNLANDYLFARKKGFKNWYGIPNVREPWPADKLKILDSEMNKICGILLRDIVMKDTPLNFSFLTRMLKAIFSRHDYELNYMKCGLGTVSIGVATDGSLFGCQENATYHDPTNPFFIGNIFDGIDKKRHAELIHFFNNQYRIFCGEECSNCSIYHICQFSACPSTNFATTGNLLERSSAFCEWLRILHRNGLNLILNAMNTQESWELFKIWLLNRGVSK